MKIAYSEYAREQIDAIYSNGRIYNPHGHFTQQFLNWNSEFHHYVSVKKVSNEAPSSRGVYTMNDVTRQKGYFDI